MVYFTSDLHLGHRAVIQMENRPFADVDEMNRTLIRNFNSVVHRNDTVYILGDLCYRVTVEEANEMISKLNGKKVLLRGNHDKEYDPALFEEIRDFMEISVEGRRLCLMHYPLLTWPKQRWGCIMVHGHMHNSMDYNLQNQAAGIYRYDCGVDANQYHPVSAQYLCDFFDPAKFPVSYDRTPSEEA